VTKKRKKVRVAQSVCVVKRKREDGERAYKAYQSVRDICSELGSHREAHVLIATGHLFWNHSQLDWDLPVGEKEWYLQMDRKESNRIYLQHA
jgi:hypothetical protein